MIDVSVFLFSVLKRWIPNALLIVDIPIVLIPAMPARASSFLLNILIVDVFTTLTKYASPSANVPVCVLELS